MPPIVPRSSTETLIRALTILSESIDSEDGVANTAILEAAHRLQELQELLSLATPHVRDAAQALHLLDGFRTRVRPLDSLAERIDRAVR